MTGVGVRTAMIFIGVGPIVEVGVGDIFTLFVKFLNELLMLDGSFIRPSAKATNSTKKSNPKKNTNTLLNSDIPIVYHKGYKYPSPPNRRASSNIQYPINDKYQSSNVKIKKQVIPTKARIT